MLPFFSNLKRDRRYLKKVFICQQCGKESPKWMGRCPDCQQWNTFLETAATLSKVTGSFSVGAEISELSRISAEEMPRIVLPINEFNRVLGGGIIPGSLVLISGDPGIGKSTLRMHPSPESGMTLPGSL